MYETTCVSSRHTQSHKHTCNRALLMPSKFLAPASEAAGASRCQRQDSGLDGARLASPMIPNTSESRSVEACSPRHRQGFVMNRLHQHHLVMAGFSWLSFFLFSLVFCFGERCLGGTATSSLTLPAPKSWCPPLWAGGCAVFTISILYSFALFS